MIKDSIKNTAGKIFKGVKTGSAVAGSYILNELAEEIEYRSPRTAAVGSYIKKQVNDIRKLNNISAANYKQFAERDKEGADEFRAEVQKNNPGLDSPKAVEKAMIDVIKRIEASIRKDPEKAKNSDLYKKYEKNFEDYSKALKEHADMLKKNNLTPSKDNTSAPVQANSQELIDGILTGMREELDQNKDLDEKTKQEFLDGVKSGMEEELKVSEKQKSTKVVPAKGSESVTLLEIATNTKETAEALKNNTPETKKSEPKTISSVIDSGAANLISKIFTEKTIDRYASKIRETLGISDEKDTETSDTSKDPIVEELKKVNKFLEDRSERDQTDESLNQENKIEAKKSELDTIQEKLKEKLQESKDKSIEQAKEAKEKPNPLDGTDIDVDTDDRSRRERKRSNRQNKKTRGRTLNPNGDKLVQAGKDKNYIPESKVPTNQKVSGGRFADAANKAGRVVGRAGRGLAGAASLASTAPGMAAGGAALGTMGTAALWGGGVLSAGTAGYGIGTLASKGIDAGLSAVTGKETSLGSWIYDQFNEDPNSPEAITKSNLTPSPKVVPTQSSLKLADRISPANTSRVNMVDSAINKQDTIITEKEEKMRQPIVITGGNTTNNNNNNSSGGGRSAGAIVASPVRNTESTFERVQMQDFWPRAK